MSNAATMVGRSLRLTTRNLDALIPMLTLPVFLMALFVYVFGGAIQTGTDYVDYVVPGLILLCVGFGSAATAVAVTSDMVNGIIDRFRSLPIRDWSVLTGHVVASVARNLVSTALVVGTAFLMGFRPNATLIEWLAAVGVIVLFIAAITWLSAALGLVAKSVESANAVTFFILFLPYVSSAFVPTDSMPTWLQAVAENQPVTPVIETLRGLLVGTPVGDQAWLAIAWCGGLMVVSFAAAAWLFRRRTSR